MKCKSEFKHDPSNRKLRCELGIGHKGWHENGITMWTDQDLLIAPRRPRRFDELPPEPKREEKKRVTTSDSRR